MLQHKSVFEVELKRSSTVPDFEEINLDGHYSDQTCSPRTHLFFMNFHPHPLQTFAETTCRYESIFPRVHVCECVCTALVNTNLSQAMNTSTSSNTWPPSWWHQPPSVARLRHNAAVASPPFLSMVTVWRVRASHQQDMVVKTGVIMLYIYIWRRRYII